MNENDKIKEAFRNTEPPLVQNHEWENIWQNTVYSLAKSKVQPVKKNILRQGFAYAAIFILGIGIGILGSRFSSTSDTNSINNDISKPVNIEQSVKEDNTPVVKSKGFEFCGLENVEIEPITKPESNTLEYRLTANTPRGIKVVMDYPALDSL